MRNWVKCLSAKWLNHMKSVVIHCGLLIREVAIWSSENRCRYDRSALRYPSDLTDEEWALIEPLIPPAKKGGAKRTVDLRQVVNGLLYVLSTGCQWSAIPQGPAAQEHGLRLFRSLGLERHADAHSSCALRPVPRGGRARGKSDSRSH